MESLSGQELNGTIEDEEDMWIRHGEAVFNKLSPEEQARITAIGDELLASMQAPGILEAVDKVFRRSHTDGTTKSPQ